jgi:ABC-2 type transport system ATP-binding protein
MSAISVRNLRKIYKVHAKPEGLLASVQALIRRRYKQVRAVDGISFDIDSGEMVGFLGPNGAGKTTTLKILSGLIYPSEGDVRVLGFVPQKRENAYRRQFALLMGQKNQLWWDLPACESFRLHKEIYGIEHDRFERVQDELTDLLAVKDLVNQPVRELSLGERMKMELIAALLHSPRVLFLDEPTIGLDVVAQAAIRRCLREYNRENQVTVLLTSHYMQDIEALCDRVLVINHGRLVHDGRLADIARRFAGYKIVTLRFHNGAMPEDFGPVSEVLELDPPKVRLRMPREAVAQEASRWLAEHQIDDVSVEEPPIEDVISAMFQADYSDDGPAEPAGATTDA